MFFITFATILYKSDDFEQQFCDMQQFVSKIPTKSKSKSFFHNFAFKFFILIKLISMDLSSICHHNGWNADRSVVYFNSTERLRTRLIQSRTTQQCNHNSKVVVPFDCIASFHFDQIQICITKIDGPFCSQVNVIWNKNGDFPCFAQFFSFSIQC